MLKKVLSVIICSLMFLSVGSINAFAEQGESLSGGQLLKQYVLEDNINKDINATAKNTVEEMAAANAMYIQSYVNTNNTAKETYGGCYIDDNGQLHVLFTKNAKSDMINTVNKMTENSVIYGTCKYSLEELNAVKEYIGQFMSKEIVDEKLSKILDNIISVGIYEQHNKVFVEMLNCTDKNINEFKQYVLSSDLIIFEDGEEYKNQINVNPGGAITINTVGASIGFRCRILTNTGAYINGFMTAGHGSDAGDNVFSSGIYIGYIQTHIYGGYVDGAFVHLNNSEYAMTNVTQHGGYILNSGTYVSGFVEGGTVYKDGSTTGLTVGKIKSTSVTNKISGGTSIKDCVIADYRSLNGDSGGVVFVNSNGAYHIAGIHRGSATQGAIFVKVKRIKDAFDVVLY